MTERERLDMQEQRYAIFERDNFTCRICGKSIYVNGCPQLAHLISQGPTNLKKYGSAIIHHPLNMWSTCSLECNTKANISNKPLEVAALVNRIREELGKEA